MSQKKQVKILFRNKPEPLVLEDVVFYDTVTNPETFTAELVLDLVDGTTVTVNLDEVVWQRVKAYS